jgi:acetate kinase
MVVSLGRLDALVFTGGIGENAVKVRAKIIELLGFLGLKLDPAANERHGKEQSGRITTSREPLAAVIPTNEELMIAMDTANIIAAGKSAAA